MPEEPSTYWAQTDPEQAAQAKKPYDDVKMQGLVEGKFIYSTAIAKHLLPFVLLTPATLVLPVEEKGGILSVVTAEILMKDGYRDFGKWMQDAETLWNVKREDKADKQSLYQWLDYQTKLTRQELRHRFLVLYNSDGMNVSATFFDRNSHPLRFIADCTLYWAAFSNHEEADYLVSVLNSNTVNVAIKPFQPSGLLGERHIHKKLLELPIPIYEENNTTHHRLSKLGAKAREEAAKAVKSGAFPAESSIARQRAFIRTHLESEMEQIDKLVGAVLKQ